MPNESETGLIWMIKGQNLEMNWGVKLFDSIDAPDGVSTLWEKNYLFTYVQKLISVGELVLV